MKRSNRSPRLLIAALISVTGATFCPLTFTGSAAAADCPKARPTGAAATHAAPMTSGQHYGTHSSPLTLFIDPPTGRTFRLIYSPGDGWRFADRAVGPRPTEASLTATPTPRSEDSLGADEPLTVFIDGPTGYSYVWMRDAGWKFVGRVAEQKR